MMRDTYFDTVKTFAIYFVVLLHTLKYIGDGYVTSAIYNSIQLVVMPLFIFVSGYFSSYHKPIKDVCIRAFGFFVAYLLFSIIWMVIKHTFTISALIIPSKTLWYILSLPCWILMSKLMLSYINCIHLLYISVVGGAVVGFIPIGNEMSLQRTFAFFPFFVAGICVRNYDFMNKIKTFNNYWALFLIMLSVVVFLFLKSDMRWLLCANVPYVKWSVPYTMAPFVRLMWYVWSTLATVSVLSVIRIIPENKLFSAQGSKTLTIYLYHFFPIYFVDSVVGYSTSNIVILMLFASGIFLLTIFLHESRLARLITNPFSIFIDKKSQK